MGNLKLFFINVFKYPIEILNGAITVVSLGLQANLITETFIKVRRIITSYFFFMVKFDLKNIRAWMQRNFYFDSTPRYDPHTCANHMHTYEAYKENTSRIDFHTHRS